MIPLAAAGNWRDDLYSHRQAVGIWFVLNLIDYGLTVAALPLGAHEWLLHSFIASLPVLVLALYKIALTAAAVAWLAFWKWLRFLKWLNLFFTLIVSSNIYDLIVRPVY